MMPEKGGKGGGRGEGRKEKREKERLKDIKYDKHVNLEGKEICHFFPSCFLQVPSVKH